jgi:HAE1 family hydrophobic/amphiphilic exporter-1
VRVNVPPNGSSVKAPISFCPAAIATATTFAAIFGTLPIAIGAGAGAELRQPLGIAVVGGLCVSQLLTLFITPVIYIYLDRIDRRLKRRLEPPADEADGVERPHVVAAE